jgi:exopolysaccharide biosynthesis polyprenyl glycosylphosphotransferase
MFKGRNRQAVVIGFFDLVVLCLCTVGAFYTRAWLAGFLNLVDLGHGLSVYLYKWWVYLAVLVAIWHYKGYCTAITVWDDLLVFWRSLFASFLVVWVVLSLQKESASVSRIIVTFSFVYMTVLLPSTRFLVKLVLYKLLDERTEAFLLERRRGDRGNELKEALNREWYTGYYISDNIYMGSLPDNIETCFIPIEYADEDTMKALKQNVQEMIIVSSVCGLSFMNTEIRTFLTKNIALITTNNGLLSPRRVILKRALDIVLASTALILFLPLFLLIPIAIRVDSKGPVFFIHRRCGMKLAEFNMIKYRTMVSEKSPSESQIFDRGPEALTDLLEDNKIRNDPRVTGMGKILRKTSLDELPQFINVIRGEMSLVGPRPDTKNALNGFLGPYSAIYSRVRPGITGLWQVSGRSDIRYDERVKLDYMYVLNWSIWLDFIIIIKTVRAILGGRGAY